MQYMSSDKVRDFGAGLQGQLLQPGDADYDEARTIWNAMIDRRPALIARCAGVHDVMASVAFASEQGVSLAVRGGGHNIAGNALCDGGLVIDLSGMRAVRVDPDARRAQVEGGALLHDFDHEAQAFGMATPVGINSTTGVGGLTLGGGGGNFGVVTRFEFTLHPVGPEITAGLIVFPFAQAKQVLTRYRDLTAALADDVSVWAVLRQAPPLPFLPAEVHGKEVVVMAFFSPLAPAAVQAELDAVRGFGHAHGEHLGAMPYEAWQQAFDPLLTHGARNYWKSHNFTSLGDEAIDTVIRYAGALPSPQTEIFIGQLGGQANRVAADATAYPHRTANYAMNVHTRWNDAQEDHRCTGWAREFFAAAAPHADGSVYINFMPQDEGSRIAQAYGANYARLREVKARYDPDNLFRQNHNIAPVSQSVI